MPRAPALPALVLAALVVSGLALAQQQPGFKFSQEDDSERQEQDAGQGGSDRGPAVDAVPSSAQGQEDHGHDRRAAIERLHRRAAAELRARIPGDQQAAAHASACAPTRRRRSAARSRRRRSTRTSRTTRTRCCRAAKRLGASFMLRGLITADSTKNPMMNVNQVDGEHALHADRWRPDHLGRRTRTRRRTRARTSRGWR